MDDLERIRKAAGDSIASLAGAERGLAGLGTVRAAQEPLKDRVMKVFRRECHKECKVWRWVSEDGSLPPLEVDTRCALCKEIDCQ
jgi:hypothetical protein